MVFRDIIVMHGSAGGIDALRWARLMIEHADQVALSLYDAISRKLVMASPRTVEIFQSVVGEGRGEIAGRSWEELWLNSPEQAAGIFRQVVEGGEPKRLPQLETGSDSRRRVWDCSLIPVREEAGKEAAYVMMSAVEITQHALARAELERVDHLRDEFLSLASHELRTPLMPLKMYAEVLAKLVVKGGDRGPGWEKQVREVLGKIDRQIGHMARLADDLLDATRVETGRLAMERKPVDLKKVLATAAEQAAGMTPTPSVRLSIPDLPSRVVVEGDEGRLVQLVLNLLSNAARHASSSPQVDLGLELVQGDEARSARVVVRDRGPGIPPEDLKVLFTRYGRTSQDRGNRSGLGLGLFICRGIVEQHGGKIRVESEPGDGAAFIVELPVAVKEAAA